MSAAQVTRALCAALDAAAAAEAVAVPVVVTPRRNGYLEATEGESVMALCPHAGAGSHAPIVVTVGRGDGGFVPAYDGERFRLLAVHSVGRYGMRPTAATVVTAARAAVEAHDAVIAELRQFEAARDAMCMPYPLATHHERVTSAYEAYPEAAESEFWDRADAAADAAFDDGLWEF